MSNFIKSNYTLNDLEKFRDKDGFIDLSIAGIQITPESKEKKGTKRLKNWIDFGGTKVLIRGEVVENYSIYAELIVEEIAKQLGIETAHYDLIKIIDENGIENLGVLSESIIDFDNEQLISLHDLIGDEPQVGDEEDDVEFESATRYEFTVDKLKERLELVGYQEEEIQKIILDYKKRLIFYLSVLDTDKHPENISFIKEINGNGKIRLSPNYDSEMSLLLERSKEMVKYFLDQPFGVECEAEVQDPKIGVIRRKEDAGWDEMWKDTLEELIEDDEVYDYYNNCICGKIDIESILQKVEARIHAKLPEEIKKTVTRAYSSRNEAIEEIMCGELKPDYSEKDDSNYVDLLMKALVNQSVQANIRTGEQLDIGRIMESDMRQEKKEVDKDENYEEKC